MSEVSLGFKGMNSLTMLFLFIFLGVILGILVLGFHKSPTATAGATRQLPQTRSTSSSSGSLSTSEPYPTGENPY